MVLDILFEIELWLFVHASYKHVSHALISKILCTNFEIRVLMFLRDLGIL